MHSCLAISLAALAIACGGSSVTPAATPEPRPPLKRLRRSCLQAAPPKAPAISAPAIERSDVGVAGEDTIPQQYALCLAPTAEAAIAAYIVELERYIVELERYARKAYILCGPTPGKETQ
jgi:hypothetical protein